MDKKIIKELSSLSPSAVLELFDLNLTNIGGEIYYFHAGTNELNSNIIWGVNENVYTRLPVIVEGFDWNGQGEQTKPILKISNLDSIVSSILSSYDDLIGGKVIRHKVFKKYLNSSNFASGINPFADPNAELPKEVYFIEQKKRENKYFVEFELNNALDLENVTFPRERFNHNFCRFRYRCQRCQYSGVPVSDQNGSFYQGTITNNSGVWNNSDTYYQNDYVSITQNRVTSVFWSKIDNNQGNYPTNQTYWTQDVCRKKLSDCYLRFNENGGIPFGGWPGIEKYPR